MNNNIPRRGEEQYESNQNTAEEMAEVQENYYRINAVKKSLGLAVDENPDAVADTLATQKQEDIRQIRQNLEPAELQQGRYEISKAVQSNIVSNLAESGINLNEFGHISPDASRDITPEIAETSSRIISVIPNLVENQTKAKLDNQAGAENVDGWLKAGVLNTEGKSDTREDFQVRELVFNAVGLNHDLVDNVPYEPGEMTSAGWSAQEKYIPTDVPGVYYKEAYYVAPQGSDAASIRIGELTTIVPQENPELIAA